MGLADAFNAEDRVNVKFSDFYKLVQQAGKYENVMNGVKCNVPHRYIREMVSGVSEEPQQADGFRASVFINDETIKRGFKPWL